MTRLERIDLYLDLSVVLRYLQNKNVADLNLLFRRELLNIRFKTLREVIIPFGGPTARKRLLRGVMFVHEGQVT